MKTKAEKIKDILDMFLRCGVPIKLIEDAITPFPEGFEFYALQDFVCSNLAKQFEYCQAIELIDAAEKIVDNPAIF